MFQNKRTFFLIVCIVLAWSSTSEALFGRKKREEAKLAKEQLRLKEAQETIPNYPVTIGEYLEQCSCGKSAWSIAAAVLGIGYILSQVNKTKAKKVDVVVVGMGMPKKGMGWYHLTQFLTDEKLSQNVNVLGVVEPFFLNPALCKSVPTAFTEYVELTSAKHGTSFVKSIQELPTFSSDTLCLIAGRTNDNPIFVRDCIAKGAKFIYLEKPGAPSVAELEEMKILADANGVKVYLGYNKNVTSYVQKALALAKVTDKAHVLFRHNNSYKKEELPECFARNSEGMLKNMAIHELALLVSFFNVTTDSIQSFSVDKDISEKLTLSPGEWMPGVKSITDFSKILFTVKNMSNQSVSIMADRCGGNISYAVVLDKNGDEVGKFEFPNKEEQVKVNKLIESDPDMMPYFFVQSDDYLELKSRVVDSIISNKRAANGVATIETAIEALKLAEYGTNQLMKEL